MVFAIFFFHIRFCLSHCLRNFNILYLQRWSCSCRDSEHDLLTFLLWLKTMLTIKRFNWIQVISHENMLLIFFFNLHSKNCLRSSKIHNYIDIPFLWYLILYFRWSFGIVLWEIVTLGNYFSWKIQWHN